MKVLAIGYGRNLFKKGNVERERIHACAKRAGELHMVVFSHRTHGLREESIDDTLFLHPTNSRSKLFMLADAIRIGREIIRSQNKEKWIVTSQDPFESGVVGWILKLQTGSLFNVQEHGDFFSGPHFMRERLSNRVRLIVGKWVLKRADCIRVVSNRIKRTLIALGHKAEYVTVLPVTVDTEKFMHAEGLAHVRDLHKDKTIILAGGRFVPQKNLELLLHAFASVVKKEPQMHLILVGTGPLEHRMKTLIEELRIVPYVTIMPWTDNMPALMKTVDIYALTSNYEGWGRVLIEAMAAGLPILTTDVGCAGEVVKDGMHGYVVPVGNMSLFHDALDSLVQDKEKRIVFGNNSSRDVLKLGVVALDEYAERWVASLRCP